MGQRAYVIIFTIVLCAAAGGLLTGVLAATKERYEANREYDKNVNIADVLGLKDYDPETPKEKLRPFLKKLFAEQVERVVMEGYETDGPEPVYAYYKYYKSPDKKEVAVYVFPIGGGGFQDRIGGYLGVAADPEAGVGTITGVSFYDNKETPGLGARISSTLPADAWIRKQYVGKNIRYERTTEEGEKVIDFAMVSRSFIDKKNEDRRVVAITGATQTSNAITVFLPKNIDLFFKALKEKEGITVTRVKTK